MFRIEDEGGEVGFQVGDWETRGRRVSAAGKVERKR